MHVLYSRLKTLSLSPLWKVCPDWPPPVEGGKRRRHVSIILHLGSGVAERAKPLHLKPDLVVRLSVERLSPKHHLGFLILCCVVLLGRVRTRSNSNGSTNSSLLMSNYSKYLQVSFLPLWLPVSEALWSVEKDCSGKYVIHGCRERVP